jgi:hypothetical protein
VADVAKIGKFTHQLRLPIREYYTASDSEPANPQPAADEPALHDEDRQVITRKRARTRPASVGLLLLAAAAAAAMCGLIGIDPAANADTAVIPVLPTVTIDDPQTPTGTFGIPPFYDGYTYEQDATYFGLLGPVDTSLHPPEPVWDVITVGPFFQSTEFKDFETHLGLLANGGIIEGSTFDHISTGPLGFDNYFEVTPVVQLDGTITNNISDAWVFDPGGLGFNGDGIISGVQLLDVPSLTTPVDELNFLGEGGTILLSVPLGGLDFFNL